jgi:hypothetical protein
VVANDPLRHHGRNALAGYSLSRLPDKPGDRHQHPGPPPARVGRQLGDRAAVFVVPRQRADAGADRAARAAAPSAKWSKSMPVEFLHGRPLSAEELEMIRQQIEEGFDNITEVDAEIRSIVARNWPHLLSKLPPEE